MLVLSHCAAILKYPASGSCELNWNKSRWINVLARLLIFLFANAACKQPENTRTPTPPPAPAAPSTEQIKEPGGPQPAAAGGPYRAPAATATPVPPSAGTFDAPATPLTGTWNALQASRKKIRSDFLAANVAAATAFENTAVGNDGIPAILYQLLADVMPDLWGGPSPLLAGPGLYPSPAGYPDGFALTPVPGGLTAVAFSCGACHVGRVMVDGKIEKILGAPSTNIDTAGYRRKLFLTVSDPRFTAANFLSALNGKAPGWYLGTANTATETAETAVFRAQAATIVTTLKASIEAGEAAVQGILGAYTFKLRPEMVNGGIPGSLDAFGTTAAALGIPGNFATLSPADQVTTMQQMLPQAAPMVDIMSVWQQADRSSAQWDANIKAKLMRNLGAELGIMRNAKKVNFGHAKAMTPFVAALPPPVYPFPVDMAKAEQGRALYNQACKSCHADQTLMALDAIGTDPNRARGLTAAARKLLIAGLKAACSDPAEPDCNVDDNDIIVDRAASPGYVSLPLAGIWARAPYLHNGSVPTLRHLLVPTSRPAIFKRGGLSYDQIRVGFDWENEGKTFQTTWPGFSNKGHADPAIFFGGHDFATQTVELSQLLEFLKTL